MGNNESVMEKQCR